MVVEASVHEALVMQTNISSHPGLLSVVLGMLSIRVSQSPPLAKGSPDRADCAEYLQKLKDQALFAQKMQVVGKALASLQNCIQKPPLSQGEAYIQDQVAIIQLPELVRELFAIAGYDPVIRIPAAVRNSAGFLTTKNQYESIGQRSGISFSF